MKKIMKIILIVIIFLLIPSNTWALEDTTENRSREAERYYTINPLNERLQQIIDYMANVLPISFREKFKDLVMDNIDISEIEKIMKEGMVKHFTAEEIKAMADKDVSYIDESLKRKAEVYLMEASPALDMALSNAFMKISPLIVKEVIDDGILNRKVKNLYSAIARDDYKTQYEMLIPAIRNNITFEAWKKDKGLDKPKEQSTQNRVEGILDEICICMPWAYQNGMQTLRCTLLVKVKTEDNDSHQETNSILEMWESVNGEWYHGYRDHHNWESCPK